MNRAFSRLPLPAKLLLIGSIPLALLVYMFFHIYNEKTQKVNLLSGYIENIHESSMINTLIESLQQERKFSFDYAIRKMRPSAISAQRRQTDSAMKQLQKTSLAGFTSYTFLDRLQRTRSLIDSEGMLPDQVMHFYSTAIIRMNTLNTVPAGSDIYFKPLHKELVAQKLLSEMITSLGIIRSNIYNALYTKKDMNEVLISMAAVYDVYKTYEVEFLQKSPVPVLTAYEKVRNTTTLNPTLRYIDTLFQRVSFDSVYDAATWWQLSENGMEQLRGIQQQTINSINEGANAILRQEKMSRSRITVFLFATLVIMVGFILYSIFSVTRMLRKMKIAAEQMSNLAVKYKTIFLKSPLPKWIYDYNTLKILDVNEAAIRHYGYSEKEFLNMSIRDIRPPEELGQLERDIKLLKETGKSDQKYWRHVKKNGEIIIVEVMAHFIEYNNHEARMVILNDVTEKIEAEKALQQSHEDLRELASHLQNIREDERASMAREVHDVLGQQVTCIKMDISWLNKQLATDDPKIKQKLKDLTTLLDETAIVVRKIASTLRPSILDDFGLAEALDWQGREFEKRSGIKVSYQSSLPADLVIEKNITTGLFRICQESLTNVARHAGATAVAISTAINNGQLVLQIADNGKGFDVEKSASRKTLGLLGMKERTLMIGGKYEIASTPGKGTTVIVTVPLTANK